MKSCPLCQRSSALLFHSQDFNRRLSNSTFDYFRCSGCRLIFLSPVPADLGRYYPPDYYRLAASLADSMPTINAQRFKLDIVQQFATQGRLLEIGPGCGEFAFLAQQAGFEVDAIEMDEACCAFMRHTLGVAALNSDDVVAALGSPGIADRTYDVIALWHVIEHLPDPWSVLKALAPRLAPGGVLLIAAPNPGSLQFRVFGRFWPHLDAPRHLLLIPLRLLLRQTRKLGLKPVWISTRDAGAQGCNQFGWNQGLSSFFEHPKIKPRMRGMGNRLCGLLRPLERAGTLGSTYTVVFQKPRISQSPDES